MPDLSTLNEVMVAMTGSTSRAVLDWLVRRRLWVQAAFLFVWLDPFLLRLHSVCGPVFHCYSCPLATFACPIGILANFSALHLLPFMAIGTLLAAGALVGTAVCGWACPFGLLQDLAGRVPTPKFRLPGWAGYARYAVLLGLVLVVPFFWGTEHPLFFCRVCPAGALEGAVPNTVESASAGAGLVLPNTLKLIILAAFVVAIFFTLRPWCILFCPLGAIFSLFNRGSMLVLRFHGNECRECGACEKMCRYGVLPAVDVNNGECIRCMECTKCNAVSLGTVFGGPPATQSGRRGPAAPPSAHHEETE
jgi:polyferredoxin